jgi:hypothetical protein
MDLIRPALWTLLIICLAGCNTAGPDPSRAAEETRFETRNLPEQKASLKKMTEGMTDREKGEFIDCMTTVAIKAHRGANVSPRGEDFMKPLRGMTRAEIEARAREIRDNERGGQAE